MEALLEEKGLFGVVSGRVIIGDVLALAWPESPGFGLALGGLGLRKL